MREIARQTVAITEAGEYAHPVTGAVSIAKSVAAAVKGTRLYVPDEQLTVTGAINTAPEIEVTHESTLKAAARAGDDGVALNFASAKNPGGGFLGGAQAQEESIARSSAIYPCLQTAREFYDFHRAQKDLRYSDRVIYSPRVPVFRDDMGNLLEKPYLTTFLTSAAPNLGAVRSNQPEFEASVPEALNRRAIRVLEIAAAHGHRTLVLGAWGCGVFRNDPATVAAAFKHALATVNRFDHVIFAIYDGLPGTPVYHAFKILFATDASR